jgi:hypothetical protein
VVETLEGRQMNSTNEKDPSAGNTGSFENHSLRMGDYPTRMTFGKASSQLKSKFAQAGHLVHDGCDNDYFVIKANWSVSRHCRDYAALIAFGRQLGVINHG